MLEKELEAIKDERNNLTKEKNELTDKVQQLTTQLEREQQLNTPSKSSKV